MENDRIAGLTRQLDSDDPLAALVALVELRRETERLEATLIRKARNQGWSWAEIARALGVSRQAVHKKHGGSRFRP